jgi:peptidylprolyl isomerase
MRNVLLAVGVSAALAAISAPAIAAPDVAKWRQLDPAQTLYVDTTKGRVVIEMYPEIAPLAVERIKQLSREKFYDGLQFHRVVDKFMAQTGDPLNTGEGGSKYPDLKDEFLFRRGAEMAFAEAAKQGGANVGFYKALPIASQPNDMMAITKDKKAAAWGLHCQGVAAMARSDAPNSANSQFYLMRNTYPSLDKRYTVWGRVIWGQEVVNALNVGEPPANPDKLLTVRVAADLPENARAPLYVLRSDSKDFQEIIEKSRKKAGADFSVCDIQVPASVTQTTKDKGRGWWHKIPLIP